MEVSWTDDVKRKTLRNVGIEKNSDTSGSRSEILRRFLNVVLENDGGQLD